MSSLTATDMTTRECSLPLQVYRRNWEEVLSVHGVARNVLRMARIITWLLLCILHWNLFHPFHMIK